MLIKTFGRNDNRIQKLDVVQLRIKSEKDDGYIYIEALVVPTICSPLTKQNISYAKNNFAHINNLEPADSGDGLSVLSVGLLVGVDFYYSFFSGKIVKGINGPVASETILGWVLSDKIKEGNTDSSQCLTTHTIKVAIGELEYEGDPLREELSKFWSIGSLNKPEEESVINKFEK